MPRINISFSEEVYKALRAYIRARYGYICNRGGGCEGVSEGEVGYSIERR